MDVEHFKALIGQNVSMFVPQEIGHGFRYGIFVDGTLTEVTDEGVWVENSGVKKFVGADSLESYGTEVIEGDGGVHDECCKQPSEHDGQVYVGMAAFERPAALERQTADSMDIINDYFGLGLERMNGAAICGLMHHPLGTCSFELNAEDCTELAKAFLDLAKQLKEENET